MAACPYSARSFNWGEPKIPTDANYSPETSVPRKKGTVEKCDFCPDMLRQGKLPHCVSACPNGVYYFGDLNEDTVTNGDETLRFSQLIKDKAGYRELESLGTEPSVYYLPAANRIFPFKDRVENKEEHQH
jgi:molybdopterin-containing oxidoreductase family iron-sulfur binding subunit